MKRFRIIENVYRKHVTVIVEPNRAKAEKLIGKWSGAKEDLSRNAGRTYYPQKPGGDLVVWVCHRDDFTALAHEFVHVAVWVLEKSGVPVNQDADEALAYLHEFFLTTALCELGHRRFARRTLPTGKQ